MASPNVRQSPRPPLTDPVDMLLADVAIRVQLSRTDYNKTVNRYQAINRWIERVESPLEDRVELFYPQGSMAINATIASKLKTDEFDIDVVAQLDLPADVSPTKVLDLLHQAIKGEPGSRYHRMVRRRTRCVTVDYRDDMHLDVTPMLRRAGTPERESWIFHHRPETPHQPGRRLVANPYGFAELFKDSTPPDHAFTEDFETRAGECEARIFAEMADSDPVPPQDLSFRKSKAVIVLQLLKRWRNVQYDRRDGRRPPSIMMAKLVADAANHTDRLSEEMLLQADHMLSVFQRYHHGGHLIRVVNPVCEQDILTDRWPGSLEDQAVFIRDLENFVAKVERLVSGCDLGKMREIMAELFGEVPTGDAFVAFNQRLGDKVHGGSQYSPNNGRLVVPATAAGASMTAPLATSTTPKHTFYGGDRHRQ